MVVVEGVGFSVVLVVVYFPERVKHFRNIIIRYDIFNKLTSNN